MQTGDACSSSSDGGSSPPVQQGTRSGQRQDRSAAALTARVPEAAGQSCMQQRAPAQRLASIGTPAVAAAATLSQQKAPAQRPASAGAPAALCVSHQVADLPHTQHKAAAYGLTSAAAPAAAPAGAPAGAPVPGQQEAGLIWTPQGSPAQRLTSAGSPAAAGHPRSSQQETHAQGHRQAAAGSGREAAGTPRQADQLAPEQEELEEMSPGRRRRWDKQQAAAARERKQLESFHYDP